MVVIKEQDEKMIKMCAWCDSGLETSFAEDHQGDIITHGICVPCQEKILGPDKVEWLEFLDRLSVPVVVIDAAGMVETANSGARKILQKELPSIVGLEGGVVFDCIYSVLPEGCGKTVHCSGCTIRNTVMDTFQSGTSHVAVEAPLVSGTPDNEQEVSFLISTEKVKGVVLLRIDSVGAVQG